MSRCDQEMCPMWDGEGCPCAAFGIDRDDPPTSGKGEFINGVLAA